MEEIWKDIPGYEGLYQVSNLGRVKSLDRIFLNNGKYPCKIKGRFLKQSLLLSGYLVVGLSNNSKKKQFYVHTLVCMAFLQHKSNRKTVVDHINNKQNDNRLSNLQIISNRENTSKDKKGYSSKYVGVHWSNYKNRWKACIRINQKKISLGLYVNEYDAHLAYQNKLKKIT